MDAERRMYYEDHPLDSSGATNIYLNAGKSRKVNPHSNGPIIHLNTGKQTELGVHLNTTFSIASSKKIKLLFLLNFLLSLVCMMVCFSVACYYWHELSTLKKQIDSMKDHLIQNLNQDKVVQSPLVRHSSPEGVSEEVYRGSVSVETSESARKFFVEDLGDDLIFVDMAKKNSSHNNHTNIVTLQKDLLISHFNGIQGEYFMEEKSLIGPWTRDDEVSSKRTKDKIKLTEERILISDGGLYLVYAQVTYLSHGPNYYSVWAQPANSKEYRLISVCSTGDDSSKREPAKAQMSCSLQTVARLFPGDIVGVFQREENRTLMMQKGFSYIGFIKLSS